ncbi:unnamed protein product [Cyclocybe aegerita]|uniref:NmrA-like domain-containing protein n=1 Tax=Cyclocybe aegerita TaxID=1973307 RepID=A0A8S0WHT6_CYCAE|nr:unnamed protein product [Cyclocybe aegerita]
MTTLLVGGTGKTGSLLAKLIHTAGHTFLIASRLGVAPEPFKAIKFDWTDSATFENPFKADPNIDRVYLITPSVTEVLTIVKPFVDLAISKGVKRFVLLSGSQTEPGSPFIGKLHEYIVQLGVDYTVLRPTWFIENFGTMFYHSIRENNEIFSVTQSGRIPFIGADDIAKAAFDALFSEKSPNKDYYLAGPGLYSYDEVAALLSDVLGRKITHKHLTNEEEQALFQSFGVSKEHAAMLTGREARIDDGVEEAIVGTNKTITGTRTLRQFVEDNKQMWIK